MKYRREIDGLRALAVLPVILGHAGVEIFSGGFVGVDIFFVISGYLITTIILDELEKDDFTIVRFYDKAIYRSYYRQKLKKKALRLKLGQKLILNVCGWL